MSAPAGNAPTAEETNLRPEHSGLRLAVFLANSMALLVAAIMYSQNSMWGFAFFGVACTFASHLPVIVGAIPALSMWGALSLVVTIGAGVRGFMISLGYPNSAVLVDLFTRGVPFESLVDEALLAVGCVVAVTVGFVLGLGRHRAAPYVSKMGAFTSRSPGLGRSGRGIRWLIAAYAVVGAGATVLYYRAVGGNSATISERRTTFSEDPNYASYGILEFIAHSGVVALLLFLACHLVNEKRWTVRSWITFIGLTANAFAINWITTTRDDLLYVTLGALLVVKVVRGRLPVRIIVGAALAVLLGIGVLSGLRATAQGETDIGRGASLAFALDSGLLNRNAFDLSKTLHVTEAVPDRLPVAHGATIGNYVLAPVPRSVWPTKPVISPGPVIGEVIYGLEHTGVPPGLVGELVWNFGRLPALVLSVVTGFLLGKMERWALRFNPQRVLSVLIYALVLMPFGKAIMGVAIGQAFSAAGQALALLLPLMAVDRSIRKRQKVSARWAARNQRNSDVCSSGEMVPI